MNTYEHIKSSLISEAYWWEEHLLAIEKYFNINNVLVYPKKFYNRNDTIEVYFFNKQAIYILSAPRKNSKFEINIIFSRNIKAVTFTYVHDGDVRLEIKSDDIIVLSSKDDAPNNKKSIENSQILLEVTALYTQ